MKIIPLLLSPLKPGTFAFPAKIAAVRAVITGYAFRILGLRA